MEELIVSAEICEDVWSPIPPSIHAAMEGAVVIVNCSASDETIGKGTLPQRTDPGAVSQADRGLYLCQCRGTGESTTDLVFGGHNLIAENRAAFEKRSEALLQ